MQAWYFHLTAALERWLPAGSVIVGAFFVSRLVRALLKRLPPSKGWRVLSELAPSLSNIVFVIGLKLFAEVAPLHPKVEVWLNHGTYVLSILIGLSLVLRAALMGIEWSTLKNEKAEVLQRGFIPLLRNMVTLFVFFSGGIMLLKHFNYDVMSLITALGVSSLAVGLAAKDTLSNMISGFILIIDQNLRPGDRINLAGTVGDVQEIGLRSTQLRLGDGNTLIVPNSELVNTKILNLSMPSRATSCTLVFRVSNTVPFSKLKATCLSIVQQVERAAKDRAAWVNLVSVADGNQLIQVGFWVNEMNDSGTAISEFNDFLVTRLREEGIALVAPALASSPT